MFSPVIATSNEPVLSTSANRAALYLFLSFFHNLHIDARHYLRLRSKKYACVLVSIIDLIIMIERRHS
jgi:hypothetical protein